MPIDLGVPACTAWSIAALKLTRRIGLYGMDKALDLEMNNPSLPSDHRLLPDWARMVASLASSTEFVPQQPEESDHMLAYRCLSCRDTGFRWQTRDAGKARHLKQVRYGTPCVVCNQYGKQARERAAMTGGGNVTEYRNAKQVARERKATQGRGFERAGAERPGDDQTAIEQARERNRGLYDGEG